MPTQRIILRNEFAAVSLELLTGGGGPRLKRVDLEHGTEAFIDPLELSSLCYWPEERRVELLLVGAYAENGPRPADDEWEIG